MRSLVFLQKPAFMSQWKIRYISWLILKFYQTQPQTAFVDAIFSFISWRIAPGFGSGPVC